LDQDKKAVTRTGAAAYGMLHGPDEGVDLDAAMLVLEVRDRTVVAPVASESDGSADAPEPAPAEDGPAGDDDGKGLIAVFIIAHGMNAEAAEAACTFFVSIPEVLLDADRVREILGVQDIALDVRWTDSTADYLATVFEFDVLNETPENPIVIASTWETFVDQAMIPAEQPCMSRERVVRLMEFDIQTARAPDLRTLFFANMLEQSDRTAAAGATPIQRLSTEGPQPTLVPCPGARAEEGRPSAMHKALAGPLPLLGSLEPVEEGGEPPFVAALAELRRMVPWMSEVVDIVEEGLWLSFATRRPWTWVAPILLHGPSGCGKTHFAYALAKTLGLGFADVSLAGSTDNRLMEGTSLGWSNARPSWPAVSMSQLGTANPFLFVDEIEKVDSSRNGDPRRTLLRMLDRKLAASYQDPGLGLPCDLSQVSWMFAANIVSNLDSALVDRMRIVKVSGPSVEQLPLVIEGVIVRIAEEFGVHPSLLPGTDQIWLPRIQESYREKRSMRAIAREVRAVVTRAMITGAKEGRRIG
jgi:hypothetical protein